MRAVIAASVGMLALACGDSIGTVAGPQPSADASVGQDAAHPNGDAATDAGSAQAATFSEIYAALFPATTNARCNFCHAMPARDTSNGKLSMGTTKDEAYQALVDKTSSSSQCGGMELIVAGDPEASLFFLKFSEPALCGARMPLGGALLSAAQLERVHSWIAAGAKND